MHTWITVSAWIAVGAVAALAVESSRSTGRAAPARRYINLPQRSIAAPFTDIVQVGDTYYLAGRLGFDASGKPPSDPVAEAKLVLDGVKSVLAAADLTMDDLVWVQVLCADLSLFETWNGVYRGYFGKDVPARAFIGTHALLRGARFEVVAVAVRR